MIRVKEIGARVRQAREDKGWLQKDLAVKLGIEPSVVSSIELGAHLRPTKHLRKIADLLQVDYDFLAGGISSERELVLEVLKTLSDISLDSHKQFKKLIRDLSIPL